MAFTAGQKVTLNKTPIYVSSDAKTQATTKTGTFYIWSAAVINARIRITDKAANVGKTPARTYVVGWVNTSAISSGTAPTTIKPTPTPTTPKPQTPTSDVTPTDVAAGQIGYIGQVLFVVSHETVQTLQNFTWSSSANYVEHSRHMKRGMIEFTGANADAIKFNMRLSAALGTNPLTEYTKLLTYSRNGTAVPLKIGSKVYGYYRWVVESLSFEGEYTDSDGDWIQANVSISLKAYEK